MLYHPNKHTSSHTGLFQDWQLSLKMDEVKLVGLRIKTIIPGLLP
jgi:hypothetical protein